MVKLLIGVKGTGKTKALVDQANAAVETTKGSVVCIEKGTKLTFNVNYMCRLIDTEQYGVDGADALYGLVAGIFASNHDVTDLFIDSTLKICGDIESTEKFVSKLDALADKCGVNCVLAASIPAEQATDFIKSHT